MRKPLTTVAGILPNDINAFICLLVILHFIRNILLKFIQNNENKSVFNG